MSKLPKRLEIIASLVNYRKVCDVGCDHGKLAEYLLNNKLVDSVIVSDISLPSLNKAIDLLSKKGYNFEYIHCDGLSGYKGKDIDQCVISGMGGDEIIKIISSSPIEINSFILSPQHNNIGVKKFMLARGYNIDYDIIISDKGKFYNIFRCIKSDKVTTLSSLNLVIGKENLTDPRSDIDNFVSYEINKVQRILNQNPDNKEFLDYLQILKQFNERK